MPNITAKQIIRYLASRYANARRCERIFRTDEEGELADHYRKVSYRYGREADSYRETIHRIRTGDVATWIIAGKPNSA